MCNVYYVLAVRRVVISDRVKVIGDVVCAKCQLQLNAFSFDFLYACLYLWGKWRKWKS
jgi:hypothetical protein